MQRPTQNKSVQTDPVIILPIGTNLRKLEKTATLDSRQSEIFEFTTTENTPLLESYLPKKSFSTIYKVYVVPIVREPSVVYENFPSQNILPQTGFHERPRVDSAPPVVPSSLYSWNSRPNVVEKVFDTNAYNCGKLERDIVKEKSVEENGFREIKGDSPYETIPESTKQPLTTFTPIYILKKSSSVKSNRDWEIGDEFEFISIVQNNSNLFYLNHLRTSTVEIMDRSWVELDKNTPLRLGIQDRGTVECLLLKCDTLCSFLIRRSNRDKNVYILSVNQHNITKEALISHYFIRINKENNCFYVAHEGKKLHHYFFQTFQQLVKDTRIQQVIPLSKPTDGNTIMTEDELWQIDYKQLIIGEKIGVGEFGTVMRGKWRRNGSLKTINVAIKRLKLNDVTSNKFAEEICAMKCLRNAYLVLLLGISVDPITNEKLMVTELMIDGDLKKWLEKQHTLPSDNVLLNYCNQICLGMSHLERKNYVHRDLACRNILLQGSTAKIADFGMGVIVEEDPYYTVDSSKNSIGKLPFRWTAPEIFDGRSCTTRSDVWSFGICLVEIWSKGGKPYPSFKHSNEIREKIKEGYVHERPPQCPRIYYDIIRTCLVKYPEFRPSFTELTNRFTILLNKNGENVSKNINKIDVIAHYNLKGNEMSPIGNLQTFPPTKTGTEYGEERYSTIEENEYIGVATISTKQQLSSDLSNDRSEHFRATAKIDPLDEIIFSCTF